MTDIKSYTPTEERHILEFLEDLLAIHSHYPEDPQERKARIYLNGKIIKILKQENGTIREEK